MLERYLAEPGYEDVAIGAIAGDRRYVAGRGKADGASIFRIASVSKVLTTLALAHAVVHDEIALDAPAAEHLPDFRLPAWDGVPIRVEHLATHTSGLRDARYPGDVGTRASFAAGLERVTLESRPGDEWRYCNTGVSLLATLLGDDYADLVLHRVCEPLGMHDTVLALDAEQVLRLRPGHEEPDRPVPTPTLPLHAGSGGWYSTVYDMLLLLAAHLDDADPAITLVRQPRLARDSTGAKMGLGWVIDPLPGTDTTVTWHNGSLAGYRSYVGFVPEARCAVAVLTNTSKSVDDIGHAVLSDLIAG